MLSSISHHSPYSISGLQLSSHAVGSTVHATEESSSTEDIRQVDTLAPSSENSSQEFSEEEQKQISELKTRDREVRTHEQAHLSAAGGVASGGPTFSYQSGPDGVRYATGGEVQIDTSAVSGDPAATMRKADAIRRAALAPANPSAQDQSVAAQAATMAAKAQADMAKENSQPVNNPYSGQKPLGYQVDISV
ncbi:MAG: putative metalloprotease CJM1_0395 family protein [Methylococcales bacterium]